MFQPVDQSSSYFKPQVEDGDVAVGHPTCRDFREGKRRPLGGGLSCGGVSWVRPLLHVIE